MNRKMRKPLITIIGAGIMGLSTGILLLKSGFNDVRIIAHELTPHTTSDTAPACWHPYINPGPLLKKCIFNSLESFRELYFEIPDVIKKIIFKEFLPDVAMWLEEQANVKNQQNFKAFNKEDLPNGYVGGCQFTTFVIDIQHYIPYLHQTFSNLGGKLTVQKLNQISELDDTHLIVNCTGMGAKQLLNDIILNPVRGQALSLSKVTSLDHAILAIIKDSVGYPLHPDYTIIVPRRDDIYIAGTTQTHDSDRRPRAADTELILKRACDFLPELRHATINKTYVGLRPERLMMGSLREARIEYEYYAQQYHLFHNYGHSGAGISASWGAAKMVVELIMNHLSH